jgi:hypothetical protein
LTVCVKYTSGGSLRWRELDLKQVSIRPRDHLINDAYLGDAVGRFVAERLGGVLADAEAITVTTAERLVRWVDRAPHGGRTLGTNLIDAARRPSVRAFAPHWHDASRPEANQFGLSGQDPTNHSFPDVPWR